MALLAYIGRFGRLLAALAILAFVMGSAVAPAGAVAHRDDSIAPGHVHIHANASDVDHPPADHEHHKTGGACLDACCGPAGCALPARLISFQFADVTSVEADWLPVTVLADLALAYSIDRPPRA